jgi:hypothetical protein
MISSSSEARLPFILLKGQISLIWLSKTFFQKLNDLAIWAFLAFFDFEENSFFLGLF